MGSAAATTRKPPQIGIIGTGLAATRHAARFWISGQADIAAACSRGTGKLLEFCDRFDVPRYYTNFDDMLQAERLDAVVIATTHDVLGPITEQAVAVGTPVLVEKPLAARADQAEAVLLAQRISDAPVMVAYPRRFRNHYLAARAWMVQGRIGPVQHAAIEWCDVHMASYLNGKHSALNFRQDPKAACGGTLLDHGSHMLDAFLWLTDERPAQVQAFLRAGVSGLEFEAVLRLSLRSGANVSAHIYPALSGRQERRISLQGSTGRLEINDEAALLYIGQAVAERVDHQPDDNALMLAFCELLQTGTQKGCSVEEAVRTVATIDAAYRSARQGEPIDL